MAGTIVADTIQDGAGNSTSMDNAIYGSAKAWVRFNGTSATVTSSYNVSSVTRNATGNYTVNFTNAFANINFCPIGVFYDSANQGVITTQTITTPYTTTSFRFITVACPSGSTVDTTGLYISFYS